MNIQKQIKLIERVLSSTRLHVCGGCGFQCMPMVLEAGKFTCPKCGEKSEVE